MPRTYPSAPICAVGGILFRDASVLLVQRGKPPAQGAWSVPGGVVHLGETLEEALMHELREEVQLEVRPVNICKVLDRIYRDEEGKVLYHYVIVDYLCEWVSGELRPGSDASEAGYFEIDRLDSLSMTEGTLDVIREVYEKWERQT